MCQAHEPADAAGVAEWPTTQRI